MKKKLIIIFVFLAIVAAGVASTVKIDVVIPAIEKDLEILPNTISGIVNR